MVITCLICSCNLKNMKHLFINYYLNRQLREKGFNEWCIAYYANELNLIVKKNINSLHSKQFYWLDQNICCSAITHSQAISWFRIRFGIKIDIQHCRLTNKETYSIYKIAKPISKQPVFCLLGIASYDSYEECAEAAIKKALQWVK